MITPGILIVTHALQDAIDTFRQNLSAIVPDVYGALPQQQQTEIQNWFGNISNKLPIITGYPEQPQQIPCIAITADNMQEIDMYEGLATALSYSGSNVNLSLGSAFRTSFSFLCLAFNYNFALYLSMLVRWGLLWERQAMTNSGLYNQRVTAQEIEPAEIYINKGGQQDSFFVYQYLVTLTAEHVDILTLSYPEITAVTSQVTTS